MYLQHVNTTDPLAVCNDGTSAGYYIAPGSGSTNLFLVYLEGAMFCWNNASCTQRYAAHPVRSGSSSCFIP